MISVETFCFHSCARVPKFGFCCFSSIVRDPRHGNNTCAVYFTHNLREFRAHDPAGAAAPWALEFGEWLATTLEQGKQQDLVDYRERAPGAVRNHPTDEHLLPLFVAAGAGTPGASAKRIHSSYAYGVIGMDAYRFD